MITLKNVTCGAVPRCCWTTCPSPQPRRKVGWSAATAPASPPVRPAQRRCMKMRRFQVPAPVAHGPGGPEHAGDQTSPPPTSCWAATPPDGAARRWCAPRPGRRHGDRPCLHRPGRRRRARRRAAAQALILGLGFKVGTSWTRRVNSFSGGWRMRLQLARADVPERPAAAGRTHQPPGPDALVWLEAWLKRYAGTLIVISHDREFLDAVTNVTLHIEHARSPATAATTASSKPCGRAAELQQTTFARQQERSPTCRSSSTASRPRPARPSRRKAASRRWTAWRRLRRCWPTPNSRFEFKEPANLPNPMLAITDGAFGEPTGGRSAQPHRWRVNRSVLAGQRIGILGANGQGKSTLVKTIAGDLPPLSGTITEGKAWRLATLPSRRSWTCCARPTRWST